ncbi:aflatoxin biosynthesis ketoreductase-like protein nor-1 [Athelia psychrophila]|uniref:Aflatoxin biosynthesis ketoreductase-like protein nor-1 n=1 Tax=Athelia psychrophila TaxID=1759441 RepID=A0A166DTG0_9AGAM|nr:aflatoxin biosynthesis ketoreductase-like protein nor-1 [Fibularhizoctonia sp. CBS 109695]
MVSTSTTYLITGSSRGIGLGLVEVYLGRANTTVISTVRSISDTTSLESLQKLKAGANSKLIIVKIDSTSANDAGEAVRLLQTEHGITALDTVIANAGICTTSGLGPVAQTPLAEIRSHFEVNTIGTLALFQAAVPLLETSRNGKFVALSDSTADLMADPFSAYGVSKAALNFIVRKIHHEHPKITSTAIYPGWVQTQMGSEAAEKIKPTDPLISVEESVAGVVNIIDNATREETSGTLVTFDKALSW